LFAALGHFQWKVVWSALAGTAAITVYYFSMGVTIELAADKAQQGDPAAGQRMIQLSSTVRLLLLGVAMAVGIKLGANVLALVLPLAFLRPVVMLAEFFGKKGDGWTESK